MEQVFSGIRFYGLSLAGIRTAISVPEYGICFDVAQGFPFMFNIQDFFISHGHLDHAAGIPYIISQKALHGLPKPKFYMPKSIADHLHEIMETWHKVVGHRYEYEFISMEENKEVSLSSKLTVRAFKTVHTIDSLGYTLIETKKKLKPEFLGLDQAGIIEKKSHQIEVCDRIDCPMVSFTGDTKIEFLTNNSFVNRSKVLLLESTYIDERKSPEEARRFGHTHLDEILPHLSKLHCEQIVLIHISSRYRTVEIDEILAKKIPIDFKDRVTWFRGR